MKTQIIGIGLSGLVGSRVAELLGDKYEFVDLSLKTGVDITNFDQVMDAFHIFPAKIVLHLAAKTDVDNCEDDKILGEEGEAYLVNVVGTQNIVEVAKRLGKRIIYISTDFVFDGTKDSYSEEDQPNPVNWYGYTKYEGEKIVINSGLSYCVVRLAYPYRAYFSQKLDFVRRIIEKAKKGEEILVLTDHVFTPTFIDDIALALDLLLEREMIGIFHLVGSQSLTPYQAAKIIMKTFVINGTIKNVERSIYFKDRAYRPFKLALKNDKITKLGVKMRKFSQGIVEMHNQLISLTRCNR